VLTIDELTLESGTVTALVGPNGSGKSTLLHILGFLVQPTAGELRLDGTIVRGRVDRRRARRRVTVVEQVPYLFPATVQDNLLYALRLHGVTGPEAKDRTRRALETLGASPLADRAARGLSEGEIRRVALARAIVIEPDVLLLDEPAGAADRAAAMALYAVMATERERGTAVCFTSHHVEDAYRWSDDLRTLTAGRLGEVAPENLFRASLPPGAGAKEAAIGPLTLTVVSSREGPVSISIPPEEILVSVRPLASSARNEFAGTVVRISEHDQDRITVTVDVGIDLAARVTRAALRELDVHVGTPVVLTIKALAVQVH
jgi:tungstate transport system ATP-binding protein